MPWQIFKQIGLRLPLRYSTVLCKHTRNNRLLAEQCLHFLSRRGKSMYIYENHRNCYVRGYLLLMDLLFFLFSWQGKFNLRHSNKEWFKL